MTDSTSANNNHDYRVTESSVLFDGPIIAVRRDTLTTTTGEATREIVEHFSAVGIAAVKDDHVLMIRQYRHGVGRYLWEVPAGLLDVVGEEPLEAAKRELAEEAGVRAEEWHLLGDVVTSPGFSEEMCRIYVAEGIEDLHEADVEGLEEAKDEEADLERRWVPLTQAIEWVQDGTVENSIAVAAILHLAVGTRRDPHAPFQYRSGLAKRRAQAEGAQAGADMKTLR
ncbi:MAG TPA: NUDIX hydrolase [Candidatus Corynebacterium gallistercoris]|uniref:NUDIX hydrolase n=1 Tax=Candidatus Corynebacterium gallistercoris TaxID=2838530 RepID=A0A9D1URG9_9CORY|nr:NUDIX hydrolase [Candidatus Corynebacterium gallistercoris]